MILIPGDISQETFAKSVKLGFQGSENLHQGQIVHSEEGAAGHIDNDVDVCKWCFEVKGQYGWGKPGEPQRSTGGWLAALPVFEPHWQVCTSFKSHPASCS